MNNTTFENDVGKGEIARNEIIDPNLSIFLLSYLDLLLKSLKLAYQEKG